MGEQPTVRVLAMTSSRDRPLLLRHCIMQMAQQSHPVDHAIYVNASAGDVSRLRREYGRILSDLSTLPRVRITYGPHLSSQRNYLAHVDAKLFDNYDLFLKIDDDDIYLRNYVEDVVSDFVERRWDYSGAVSDGYLNGPRLIAHELRSLGLSEEDHRLGIPEIMPPTIALSRKAALAILEVEDQGVSDDFLWRRHLGRISGMKMCVRPKSNFIYNIHGGNISTSAFLER
jgi:hypothetical protein